MQQLVVWTLDMQCYALPLSAVERVARAVEVLPLPTAPDIVCGIVNVQGQLVPVVDMRRRFGLPLRDTALADQIVIAQSSRRKMAFFIDAISGIVECDDNDVIAGEMIVPGLEHVAGIAKLDDGMILIQDMERFLSLDEETALDKAMSDVH
jgi:purine-binding chemotaxis protein CheW